VAQVKCRICSDVEGHEKLLLPKIDGLWKHAGRRRALANFGNVRKGDFYFLSTNQHVKNKKIYFARDGWATVLQQLARGVVQERRKKLVQFRLLFHLLSIGRPMTDFSNSRELLQQLEVPECPKKHWSEGSGWQRAWPMPSLRRRCKFCQMPTFSAYLPMK
jgi:hypothetical protein